MTIERLPAAEGQQLPRQSRGSLGGLDDVVDVFGRPVRRAQRRLRDRAVAQDHRQHVVELVSESAGQLAERTQLLRAQDLLLHLAALLDVAHERLQPAVAEPPHADFGGELRRVEAQHPPGEDPGGARLELGDRVGGALGVDVADEIVETGAAQLFVAATQQYRGAGVGVDAAIVGVKNQYAVGRLLDQHAVFVAAALDLRLGLLGLIDDGGENQCADRGDVRITPSGQIVRSRRIARERTPVHGGPHQRGSGDDQVRGRRARLPKACGGPDQQRERKVFEGRLGRAPQSERAERQQRNQHQRGLTRAALAAHPGEAETEQQDRRSEDRYAHRVPERPEPPDAIDRRHRDRRGQVQPKSAESPADRRADQPGHHQQHHVAHAPQIAIETILLEQSADQQRFDRVADHRRRDVHGGPAGEQGNQRGGGWNGGPVAPPPDQDGGDGDPARGPNDAADRPAPRRLQRQQRDADDRRCDNDQQRPFFRRTRQRRRHQTTVSRDRLRADFLIAYARSGAGIRRKKAGGSRAPARCLPCDWRSA